MPILGTDDTIRYDNMAISDNSDNEHVSPGPCKHSYTFIVHHIAHDMCKEHVAPVRSQLRGATCGDQGIYAPASSSPVHGSTSILRKIVFPTEWFDAKGR